MVDKPVSRLYIIKEDIYEVDNVIELDCHIATSEAGHKLLKASYICNIKNMMETLEGNQTFNHQLSDVTKLFISDAVARSSLINRYKDWADISYKFLKPLPICRINRKDITCKWGR